jgi:hypothetical protein
MRKLIPPTEWGKGFVAGLVCGEGNFTIAISRQPSCRLGYHIRPIFQIEMGKIDEHLIVAVRDFFGFGGIIFPAPRTRARNESPTVRYTVTAMADCLRLETFFSSSPLIGAKRLAFGVWCRCLAIIRSGRHTATEGFREIVELRETINQFRRPSTFRTQHTLKGTATEVECQRDLAVCSDTEIKMVLKYLAGKMTRPELIESLGRTTASVANQIKRLRSKAAM